MKKKTICVVPVLLALIGVMAWLPLRGKESPEFAEVKRRQEKLLADKSFTESELEEGWKVVKQKWSTLSEREQEVLLAQHQGREKDKIDRFLALETKPERDAFLDKEIARWEDKKKRDPGKRDGKKAGDKDSTDKGKRIGTRKVYDHEAMRAKLREHLDSKSADDRVRETLYWRALKERWSERQR